MNIYDLLPMPGDDRASAPDAAPDRAPAPAGDVWGYAAQRSEEMGIPVTLTRALMQMESGGKANAVSYKGASGPLQVMPGTMREMGYDPDTATTEDKIDAGLEYLKRNYERFGSWDKALAAYHAGPGAVERAGGIPDTTDGLTRTPDYVSRIMGAAGNPQSQGAGTAPRAGRLARPVAQNIFDLLPMDDANAAPSQGGTQPSAVDAAVAQLAGSYTPTIMQRFKAGASGLVRDTGLTGNIVTGNQDAAAQAISQGASSALPQSADAHEMAADIAPYEQAYKNASGGDAVLPFLNLLAHRVGEYATHPHELAGTVAEGAASAAPMIGGMFGGAAAGTAMAPGFGTVAGAFTGGTAGAAIPSIGGDFQQRVMQQAAAQGIDPRDKQALLPIVQQNWDEFTRKAVAKGLTSGAVMTLLNMATAGVAGAGEKLVANEANAIINGVETGALNAAQAQARSAALQATVADLNSVGSRVARGAGTLGGEVAANAGGEAAGEVAAGDEINPTAIADQAVLTLAQSATMAAGRRPFARITGVGGATPLEESLARVQDTIGKIGAAGDVDSAIKAAVEANAATPAKAPEAEAPAMPRAAERAETLATDEPERIAQLQRMVDHDAAQQEQLNAQRGYAQTDSPGETPPVEGRLNDVMPPTAPRDMLETAQQQTNQARAAAGLDTKLHTQPGEENTISLRPTPMRGDVYATNARRANADQGYVDLSPMSPQQARNRLVVMRDMLKNEGGDPASLYIAPHPHDAGKLAIRSRDNAVAYENPAARSSTDAPFRRDGVAVDPVKAYVDQARAQNTEQARAFVQAFDQGKIKPEDVQQIIDREAQNAQQQHQAPPLTYDEQGNPRLVGDKQRGTQEPVADKSRPVMTETGKILEGTPTYDFRGPKRGELVDDILKPRERVEGEQVRPPEGVEKPGEEAVPPPNRRVADEVPPRAKDVNEADYTTDIEKDRPADKPPFDMNPQDAPWAKELPARTDNPVLRKMVEGNDKAGIANFYANHENPLFRLLGRYLQENTTTRFLSPEHRESRIGGANGVYAGGADTIAIHRNHMGNEYTVAHEVMHALTAREMRFGKGREHAQAMKRLEALYHRIKDMPGQPGQSGSGKPSRGGWKSWYGTTHSNGVFEMVAEGFTNRDFQHWLQQIPYGKKSAWTKFVEFVADMLGISRDHHTALTELLTHTQRVMEMQAQKYPKTPEGRRAPTLREKKDEFILRNEQPKEEAAAAREEPTEKITAKSTIEQVSKFANSLKASDAARNAGAVVDGIARLTRPQGRTGLADETAKLIVHGLGSNEMNSVKYKAELASTIEETNKATGIAAKLRDYLQSGLTDKVDALFNNMKPEDTERFMQAMDSKDKSYLETNPQLKAVADVIGKMFAEKAAAIQGLGTGALENLRENYFPHIWKKMDEDTNKQIYQRLSKRPLEGNKDFAKQRVFDDIQAGREAGYELISNNPLDIVALKMHEMDKYILAHKTLQALEGTEGVHLLPAAERAPSGYTDVNGRYGNITRDGKQMRYVARDDVAQVMNNYLSASLYHNKYVGNLFTGYMKAANTLNQFQLGMGSAFHAGFTSIEAVISHGALGFRSLSQGNVKDALKYFGQAPAAWITNPRLGGKIVSAMLDSGAHPEMAHILQGLEYAGFKWQMDQRFKTNATQEMMQAWAAGKKGTAAFKSLTALAEQTARPILEWLVPRQKFGVFAEMYNKWINDHGGMDESGKPKATHEELRDAAQQIWNRVDSRLGQVVYDRLFVHNVVKNIAQMAVRAPGWTGGTILEVGGGAKDLVRYAGKLATGKGGEGMSDRAAYVMSMLTVTALTNAIMTAAFTGESPQDWRDLVAFRTGNVDEHGRPERFVLPSYVKDVVAYMQHPGKTLVDKAHPALSLIGQVARNKDYQGTEIRSEDDNLFMQAAEAAGFTAKQFVPFWMQGVHRENERGGSLLAKVAPEVGVMPAPSDINKSAAERLMSEYGADRQPQGSRTSEERAKSDLRQEIYVAMRKGDYAKAQELLAQGREQGVLGTRDESSILKQSQSDPLVNSFKKLTYAQAARVMDKATDDEREKLEPLFNKKRAQQEAQHGAVEAD